ncbi:MAG: 3-phosphoglycerate dehydrogenase [Clostridiales bacterium]|nr:3-phosphoglycerate dehydrogenase [Clostridiales bacterium]
MYNILTLNKISKYGLEKLDAAKYTYGDAVTAPDAVLVRSAAMHDMTLDKNTVAIARCGAGTNNIPVDRCAADGVVVFNTPGANANGVKELVICALLLASRKIVNGIEWCKTLKGNCEDVGKAVEKGKSAFVGPEIKGKTLGIIGLGAIGRLVADAAISLGMTVIGYDPFPVKGLNENVNVVTDTDSIFAASDYITLHAPSTPDTKGIINAANIKKMKDGARILNFARGDLVVSADLLAALESGKIAAYATDFPSEDMLGLDGIIAIPHLGASTPESEDNCAVMAAEEVTAYIETGAIKNSVNFPNAALTDDFTTRVCVLSTEAAAPAVQAALGDVIFSGAKKGFAYTVADKDADVAAIEKIDGVSRVRVIKK